MAHLARFRGMTHADEAALVERAGRDPTKDATGEIAVPVVLHLTQELNAPAEFGLWLQLRADADAPPEVIDMPEAYRWRYTP